MKNLVTGGAGFIGSNLIESLIEDGEEVICIDDFCTGDKKNFAQWESNPQFKFIFHDVVNPIYQKVDRIWHLACPASTSHYQKNPLKTSLTNYMGTLNMLKLAKDLNAEILFTSTSEIYGNPSCNEQSEQYMGSINPIGPRSCYGEGKRIAETLCIDYFRSFNTKVKIARIFNVYGPKMRKDDGRLIPNLITQVLTNKPLTIYGSGNQKRSFCFIDDLIMGLKKLMNSNYPYPVNFGNPTEEYSILDIARLILSKTNSDANIIYLPLPEDDPLKRKPSVKLAKNLLSWEPKTDINKGLNKTVDYIKKHLV